MTVTTPVQPTDDPTWYKDAIIYQLHLKSFFDADNDGVGDFKGLIEKARLYCRIGRHSHLDVTVLSLAPPRRRLRYRGLSRGPCLIMALWRMSGALSRRRMHAISGS